MSPRLLGIVLVGAACVAAAGTGAYVATRHNANIAVTAPLESLALPSSLSSGTGAAVTETEVQLGGQAAAPVAEAAPPTSQVSPTPSRVAPRPVAPVVSDEKSRTASSQTTRSASAPAPARESRPSESKPVTASAGRQESAAPPEPVVPAPAAPAEVTPPVATRTYEPPPAPEPPPVPERRFEDLVVPADAVIGLQIDNSISSGTARVEDRVTARVARDVRTAGAVAIPAGSKVQGSVVVVERGGKFKERARLGIRFHTLVLADGLTVPIHTETVYREGDSPTGQSAAKISGGAIGGAIIGAILGGGRGAIIGGATGAGAGTAAVAAGDGSEARLPAGASVTVRLSSPVSVSVER